MKYCKSEWLRAPWLTSHTLTDFAHPDWLRALYIFLIKMVLIVYHSIIFFRNALHQVQVSLWSKMTCKRVFYWRMKKTLIFHMAISKSKWQTSEDFDINVQCFNEKSVYSNKRFIVLLHFPFEIKGVNNQNVTLLRGFVRIAPISPNNRTMVTITPVPITRS